jgi:hypothetical protein
MRRREFLRIGGAGCLGLAAAPRLTSGAWLEPPTAMAAYRAPGVEGVVDARRLSGGLSGLAGGSVRVTVHGLAAEARTITDCAALDVVFPVGGGAGDEGVRVQAWAMRAAGLTGQPAAVTLRVPVSEEGLRLEPSWNERVFPVRLSIGRESNAPKLRFGDYHLSAGRSPGIRLSIEPDEPSDTVASARPRPSTAVARL